MRWRNRRAEQDFHQEIDAHIAIEADRLIAEGLSPEEARSAARRTFGNVTGAEERHFEAGRWTWLDHLAQDTRYALRLIHRQPALALAVVLTVAIALAANTALFAIFDGLLFRPLPFPDADRIVSITVPRSVSMEPPLAVNREKLRAAFAASPLFAEYARVIESPVFFQEDTEAVGVDGLRAAQMTPGLFEFIGVEPFLGRVLSEDEVGAYSPTPVMIGYDLWRTRFGGDPSIVGSLIRLPKSVDPDSDRPLVVGVLPKGFSFPDGANVWHLAPDLSNQPVNIPPPNYGRLADGASLEQVRAAFPRLIITPLREHVRPRGAWALGILLAATGLLLLVAWVQVAALLFARSAGRATELGVRLALGATRWSLTRQFAVDALVIAAGAIGLATIVAPGLTALVVRILPAEMTAGQLITLDRRTLVFSAALSSIGILIAALAPMEVLRHSSPLGLMRGSLFGQVQLSAKRTRRVLLVAQLAVTTMLLYMAGLALHSFVRVGGADLGFEPDHLVAFRLPSVFIRYGRAAESFAEQNGRFNDIVQTLPTLPGVVSSGGGRLPFMPLRTTGPVGPMRTSADPQGEPFQVRFGRTTPGFFATIGLRIREGRAPRENEAGALVNATLAHELARFGPVLGQVISNASPSQVFGTYTVVGVFDNLVLTRPDETPEPEVMVAGAGFALAARPQTFVARVAGTGNDSIAAIRTMLQRIYPDRPPRQILRLADEAKRATTDFRARSIVLGAIGLLCVPLAMAGIAGALLHATRQQAREIGIRMALGAEGRDIRRRVVGHALGAVGVGLMLGLAGGLGLGRWMSSYLFGVSPADPLTIAGVGVVLVVVAVTSALWPARRASMIDPSVVLRDA